jgi:hypothetical protein
MVYLFAKLKKHANEVQKTPNPSTDRYIAALNHGFAKFSEYYTKVDEHRPSLCLIFQGLALPTNNLI